MSLVLGMIDATDNTLMVLRVGADVLVRCESLLEESSVETARVCECRTTVHIQVQEVNLEFADPNIETEVAGVCLPQLSQCCLIFLIITDEYSEYIIDEAEEVPPKSGALGF